MITTKNTTVSASLIPTTTNTTAIKTTNSKPYGTIEQAVDLYQKTQDQEIFNHIYHAYTNKITSASIRNRNEEIIGELNYVLVRAVSGFKISSGVKFNTFFWRCAKNHMGILKTFRKAQKRIDESKIVSINHPVKSKNIENATFEDFQKDDASEKAFDTCLNKIVFEQNIFPKLKENDVIIVKMLLDGYTLEDIGKKLNVTAPAIHIRLKRLVNRKEAMEQLRSLQKNSRS